MFFIPIKSSMAPGDPSGGERFGRALCQLARRRLARGHPNRCFFSDFWGHCFENLATVKLIYQCRSRQPCARQRRTGQVMRIWMFDSDLFCTFWMHFVHSNLLAILVQIFFASCISKTLSSWGSGPSGFIGFCGDFLMWIYSNSEHPTWIRLMILMVFVEVCWRLFQFAPILKLHVAIRWSEIKTPMTICWKVFHFFHIVSSC